MTIETGIAWGVVHTDIYAWEGAAERLKLDGFPVFSPRIRTIEVKHFSRRKALSKAIERPLFPGYCFAAWEAGSDDWARIVETRGVVDLLRSCGKHSTPSLVPGQIMSDLMIAGELIDLTKAAAKPERASLVAFAPGDLVTVEKPGFDGHVWKVARLDPRKRIRFILNSVKAGFEKFELSASAEDLKMVAA